MRTFEDSQEVDEWLEPLSYDAFWDVVAPYDLALQTRESCDAQIAQGIVDEALVLRVLKGFARRQIVADQGLKRRLYVTEMSMH